MNCLKTVMMVVMEFVEGGSLSSYLEKLKVQERERNGERAASTTIPLSPPTHTERCQPAAGISGYHSQEQETQLHDI